jgi:DNA invertase Pin-like site-specific DNA recombinase
VALAACRAGDTLVVTKLDRLARSLPDARAITDELTARLSLSLGGSVYDPTDAVGRLRGKEPKLNRKQEARLVSLVTSGEYSTLEVVELFGVGRSTVQRAIERQRVAAKANIAEATARR